MGAYDVDREFGDKLVWHACRLITTSTWAIAPDHLDRKEATDMMTRPARMAVRTRRYGYAEKYPFEFTVRSLRDNGVETEMMKIISGYGDWLFYGHVNAKENAFLRWFLIDLTALRRALILHFKGDVKIRMGEKPNGDGTHFTWFDLTSFSPTIVLDSSHDVPEKPIARQLVQADRVPDRAPLEVPDDFEIETATRVENGYSVRIPKPRPTGDADYDAFKDRQFREWGNVT